MQEHSLSRRVLSGEAGWWAGPIRAGLAVAEAAYAGIIRSRNLYFDNPKHVRRVGVPVISVGNITVGGTGKTPLIIELARRLERRGHNPAVVARGVGSRAGQPGDEELLVRKYCPAVAYVADADRWHGAELAVHQMGADVVLLDDGFQHRRLGRDLDIVVIDAICPFGYGRVLPRGLLREPMAGLSRAGLFVVTRCEQVARTMLQNIEGIIRRYNEQAAIVRCATRVAGVDRLDGTPIAIDPSGSRVLAFAAIGRPQAFVQTLRQIGFDVVATRWWPDHHRYNAAEVKAMFANRRHPPPDLALTTEKDAVKLAAIGVERDSLGVVRIELDFEDRGEALDLELDRVCRRKEPLRDRA